MTPRLSDLPLKDFRSRRNEVAEAYDNNVQMTYGRCLRPALYSSLRSSPSHPAGVSALRVTIAIASARFARKPWGALQLNCQSRSANRQPADVFGRLSSWLRADGLIAFCAPSPATLGIHTSDGGERPIDRPRMAREKAGRRARPMWLVGGTILAWGQHSELALATHSATNATTAAPATRLNRGNSYHDKTRR
jgi:hypothetical protein